MSVRNALPFEFPYRWPDLRRFFGKVSDEGADFLDQRDRDLEDFLAGLGGGAATLPFFVVAADASDESKALAMFQCDGTNDEVEIQAAVDAVYALQATGSSPDWPSAAVVLSEGTFDLSAAVDTDGSGTPSVRRHYHIRGQGPHATRLVRNTGAATSTSAFVSNAGTGCSVEGVGFTGFYSAVYNGTGTAEGFRVNNCRFYQCTYGVDLYDAGQWEVTDCEFEDTVSSAISLDTSSGGVISDNRFAGNANDIAGWEIGTLTITGNESNNAAYFLATYGYTHDLVVADNVVLAPFTSALTIDDASTPAATITNLSITGNQFDGPIEVSTGSTSAGDTPAIISDNRIGGIATIGCRAHITGNFVLDGLVVNDPCDWALVSNNTLGDAGIKGSAVTHTLTDNTTGAIVKTGAGNLLDGTWT